MFLILHVNCAMINTETKSEKESDMAKREIAPEERRVVSKKKKIVILVLFFVGLLVLVWYRIPYEKTYTAELLIRDEGERPMYGDLVDVEVRVKVQRYFFYDTVHTGTVTVNGDRYETPKKIVKNFAPLNMLGTFLDADSFALQCSEWHGDYLLTRCIATVSDGRIVNVYLMDDAGVYAGQYGPMPKGSQ